MVWMLEQTGIPDFTTSLAELSLQSSWPNLPQ